MDNIVVKRRYKKFGVLDEANIILIILLLGTFSDILRIPNTSITFFRLSLPISCIIIVHHSKWIKRFIIWTSIFLMLNIMYNFCLFCIYRKDLSFHVKIFIMYVLLYISIFVVFALVGILKSKWGKNFELLFLKYLCQVGNILILVMFLKWFLLRFGKGFMLDNPNNYGCNVAAVFPFFLLCIQKEKKKRFILYVILGLVVIYLNDAKLALFGVMLQIAVWVCISSKKRREDRCIYRYLVPFFVLLMITIVIIQNPAIHKYRLQDIISEPLRRIVTNTPYEEHTISSNFRTNIIIWGMEELRNLKGMGWGAGNSGYVSKVFFPNINPEGISLSLHNAWLEFGLDMGLPGIILMVHSFFYAVKLYMGKLRLSFIEKAIVIFSLTCPIWIMGPSGIYTLYFLFSVMAYLVWSDKKWE